MACRKYPAAGKFAANVKTVTAQAEMRMRREMKVKTAGRSAGQATSSTTSVADNSAVKIANVQELKIEFDTALTRLADKAVYYNAPLSS
eukprot:2399544-Pleurochrysis_carterae.AAC.1